jgi:ferredoxin
MRVRVDPDRCQGHMRCVAVAEDLFEADELGFANAIGDGTVAPEQEARARLAMNNCPEYAVEVIDD